MNEVAAPDDQHPFITQRSESLANFIVISRRLSFINAQLHHRNISLGKDVTQNRPGSVIKAPARVKSYGDWRKQRLHTTSKVRITRRRVFDLVEVSRKTAE